MLYRALSPLALGDRGMWPTEVGEHEFWQLGVILGGDIGPRGPRIVIPPVDVAPGSGPVLMEID